MKIAVVSLCLLAFFCCGVTAQPIAPVQNVWAQLQAKIADIFDRNQGKKTTTDINQVADQLRNRIEDAINNISEAKMVDIDKVIRDEVKDIDSSFGISEFFKKVGKAIDANIEFKNTGRNKFVYFF